MNKKISFKYKQLILPAVVNGILVLMIIGVASFAINKTSELNHNVSATSKENDVLSARLSTLESSSQTVDEAKSSVTVALPANNSATLVISQLRRLANENEVTLDDLSLFINDKPGDVVDIKEITIDLRLSGEYSSIANFVSSLADVAPIIHLVSSDLRVEDGIVKASLSLLSYFADLPESLPSIKEPITELSAAQQETLEQVKALQQPLVEESLEPGSPGEGRPNPFESGE
ncbi:hypothetical protein A2801_02780 [Candidatus Woesebacteria bacterium RIFCSPHIGHO2_01_FULL_41_10]|uniref:Pilus assembly protein PilO n=1 Tax=Candidatus Woesebacteria bacterium RIFCSPHIGHO2_01_FULL_41_10 TaxID=1802500 RepID=A0A1F7YNE2_9BACT|nr:MAG: hypothetical protein A2801_02780 [Candidatus Woesebacteria bacterium RIFCSPHIGHO2_01_FULL_41_10]